MPSLPPAFIWISVIRDVLIAYGDACAPCIRRSRYLLSIKIKAGKRRVCYYFEKRVVASRELENTRIGLGGKVGEFELSGASRRVLTSSRGRSRGAIKSGLIDSGGENNRITNKRVSLQRTESDFEFRFVCRKGEQMSLLLSLQLRIHFDSLKE